MLLQTNKLLSKKLFFLSLCQKKKVKNFYHDFCRSVSAATASPFLCVNGKDRIPNQTFMLSTPSSSPTTLTISSHPKCSACVSTARSHACVHVHPSMHTQRATLMSIQLLARLPGTPAKPGERLRAAAARGSRRDARPPPPPRAIRPRRGPTTTSAPLRRPAPSPAGLRQHPLEEEVPLLPEA